MSEPKTPERGTSGGLRKARKARGGLTAALSATAALLLMAHDRQLAFGVPLGLVFVAIAAFGILDTLGSFEDTDHDTVASVTALSALRVPLILVAVHLVLFGAAVWGAQCGLGSQWMWGAVVTASFVLLVAAVFRLGAKLGPWAKDELGAARPLHARHGFWVTVLGAVLYFPALGIFSLTDPWETHYGNVAREILARDDWISLWWAHEGWFWSKPILNFWMQSLAMATLGTHYQADQMLHGVGGAIAHPEWVVRTPNVLLTIVAMYLLYKGVAKVFGRRAGFIGSIVLATMPDWFFIAHQTMADMPCVASMTAAMGLLLLGLHTDPDKKVRLFEVTVAARKLRFSGFHLVFGAILLCAIPQILYLFSRNVELILHGSGPFGFRLHFDEFRSGSAGNCGLPGNAACVLTAAASIPRNFAHPSGVFQELARTFGAFEPFLQGALWSAALTALLVINMGERRVRRLFYIGAWFFAALATMAKGPMGFVIPMLCAFAYVCTKKRWSELVHLEIVSGVLVILVVALPWFLAMYIRHGSPFVDQLIFHDIVERALGHVHDTNAGEDTSFRFYIWQLGYALFPWTGFAPLGLVYWLRRGDSADKGRGDASVFLAMWFLFAFALFSFMNTKFHHYIFPAVPPAAMLIGVVMDDMLGKGALAKDRRLPAYLALLAVGVLLMFLGVAGLVAKQMFGAQVGTTASTLIGAALLGIGALVVGVTARVLGAKAHESGEKSLEERESAMHERRMLGAAVVSGAFVIALIGRDLYADEGPQKPGAIRLIQLFTYNYARTWPETLNFTAPLAAFAVIAAAIAVAMCVRVFRRHLIAAFLALGCLWALWALDVFLVKAAPHWGQREVIATYYEERAGPEESLVAYQMNWKGENFYTSNHIAIFVSTGAVFTTWLKTQRDKGVKVLYFVTEHGRLSSLKSEVAGRAFSERTDRALNNKFVLVRVEL